MINALHACLTGSERVMKRAVIIILVLLLAVFALTSVRFIRIGETHLIVSCPRIAVVGSTVNVRTVCVTDGWLDVSCSGADVEAVQEDLFRFVMPRRNVRVRARFVSDDFGV